MRGRQQVKRVLNKCVICRRLQSRPFDELAAHLPIERIRKAKPFDQCGVDFAGRIYYKPTKAKIVASRPSAAASPEGVGDPIPNAEGSNPITENAETQSTMGDIESQGADARATD